MVTIRKEGKGVVKNYYITTQRALLGKVVDYKLNLGKTKPGEVELARREFSLEADNAILVEYLRDNGESKYKNSGMDERALQSFAIEFTANSQRMAGSRLSLLETRRLIENGEKPHHRSHVDTKEALSHYSVFISSLKSGESMSLDKLRDWHWEMFMDTEPAVAGDFRDGTIGHNALKPSSDQGGDIESQLSQFFTWFSEKEKSFHPIILAGLLHAGLYLIKPFSYGNDRFCRFLMNRQLYLSGFRMLSLDYANRYTIRYNEAVARMVARQDPHEFLRWYTQKYLARFV